MDNVIVNHKELEVVYKYSYRLKKIHLKVNSYGQIVIVRNAWQRYFGEEEFIKGNSDFIQKQLDRLKIALLPTFKNASKIEILGKPYTVYRSKRIKDIVMVRNGLAIPRKYSPQKIKRFFMRFCYRTIKPIYEEFQRKYGFEKLKMKVVSSYDYWGECSTKKYDEYISFNTCLAFVPIKYMEYVVVHELCHLIHMNHSKLFWGEVEKIMPDAKKRRKELHKYPVQWYLERLGVKGRED